MTAQLHDRRYQLAIHHRIKMASLISAALLSAILADRLSAQEPRSKFPQAPELTAIDSWVNSEALTLADQKGKVVVLHFWTFGCINCQRNLPHYNKWFEDFAKDKVTIIGVHTPETANEADEKNVAKEVKKLKIKYPVAIDGERATWQAYRNQWWPSIYLIDKAGRVRFRWDGELEYQEAGGDKIVRAKIKELLAERDKTPVANTLAE